MAKLNKQEINAIANKVLRILKDNQQKIREERIKNYIPSERYSKVKECLEKIRTLNLVVDETLKSVDNEITNFDKISLISIPNWSLREVKDDKRIEAILNTHIELELVKNKLPTIEELKEDITIEAIDDDFDANDFIEILIEKYK